MNQKTLLQNALNAINTKRGDARQHLKQAEALQLTKVIEYWTQQVEEHEATYKGLLDWLFTLNGGDQ